MFDEGKGRVEGRAEVLAALRRRISSVAVKDETIGSALRPNPVWPSVTSIDDDFPVTSGSPGVRPTGRPTSLPTVGDLPASGPAASGLLTISSGASTAGDDHRTVLDDLSAVVPVPAPLAAILPRGGLPKGGVISLAGGRGVTSLLLSLLATPTGAWSALVGMPDVGLLAAAEFGLDLNRLVVIPEPGPDLLQVLSVLSDGVDLIAVAPPHGGFTAPARLRVLTGRLRQRGAVLLVTGGWPGADLVLRTQINAWSGIGQGHGRLRDRELTVEVRGRGAAGRHRSVTMLLRSGRSRVELLSAVTASTAAGIHAETPLVADVG